MAYSFQMDGNNNGSLRMRGSELGEVMEMVNESDGRWAKLKKQ